MKVYYDYFNNEEYIENGECRPPKKGEFYIGKYGNMKGRVCIAGHNYIDSKEILILKGGKKMNMKYEILRDITARTIFESGSLSCQEFCKEYADFLHYLFYERKESFNFNTILDQSDIEDIYKRKQASWIRFLVDNGFIREEIEKTYHVGQRFRLRSDKYILSHIVDRVFLINLKTGNVWRSNAINIRDVNKITEEEFKQIADGNTATSKDFELIEE